MGVRINTNIEAMNAQRNLALQSTYFAKAIERLSSGLRINRAGDDAAGLSISEKLRAQVRGLQQAMRNAQDGISMIGTAEGALNEAHAILQRMRELAVQAGNDTLSTDDRTAIGDELVALKTEINRISTDTQFNGMTLIAGGVATVSTASEITSGAAGSCSAVTYDVTLTSATPGGTTITASACTTTDTLTFTAVVNGSTVSSSVSVAEIAASGTQTLTFQNLGITLTLTNSATSSVAADAILGDFDTSFDELATDQKGAFNATLLIGANSGQTMSVGINRIDATTLGDETNTIDSLIQNNQAVATSALAQTLLTTIDDAVKDVSELRGSLGALQNRLEHTIANLGVGAENLSVSESRIRDADLAQETVFFTKTQILQSAGIAILAQANQAPQSILALLR